MAALKLQRDLPTVRKVLNYTFRYKQRLIAAIVCSVIVSILSVVSITMLMPILETIFGQTDQQHLQHSVINQQGDALESRAMPETSASMGATPDFIDQILNPLYKLIELYAHDNKMMALFIISLVFFVIVCINGIFRYIQQYLVYWLGSRVILDMQRDLFVHLSRFDMAFYSRNKVGSLISYFTVDIRAAGNSVYKVFGQLLLDPFLLLFTVVALLTIQWQLTLIYAVIFPAIIYTIRYFANKNRNAGREAQAITASMGSILQEHFSNIRVIQAYGMQDYQHKKFYDETLGVFRSTMTMLKAIAASSPINQAIGMFGFSFILLVGGYFIFYAPAGSSPIDGPKFILFLALLASVYQPTKRLERAIQEIQLGLAAADRVFDVLEQDASLPIKADAKVLKSFDSHIEFNQVSFAYQATEPILRDITLTINKGEHVAVVGPSGAGKTTLINLVPRFFDPDCGVVKIDGVDLRDLDLSSLRNHISLVSQETAIFSDTIWNNLTCGASGYSATEVIQAAQAAYAHDFIEIMPQQYQTMIGERGDNLSGGQRQRIAVARAILKNAPILIFDEATSALDSESETHIKNSLNRLLDNRTSIIIAHRLSTIMQSDKIVVMNQGGIVDVGPHHELIKRCELYARLYRLQFHDEPQS